MKRLKIIIIIASLSAAIFTSLSLYYHSTSYRLEEMSHYFVSRDLNQALLLLESLKSEIPKSQEYLLRSYIARAKGGIETSDQLLIKAIDALPREKWRMEENTQLSMSIQQEILLNQILNAFLTKQLPKAGDLIDKAFKETPQPDRCLKLLATYRSYLQKDYHLALSQFNSITEEKSASCWLQIACDEVFPEQAIDFIIAHCNLAIVEKGEDIQIPTKIPEDPALQHFLLGIADLKNAGKTPGELLESRHVSAHAHFSKIPLEDTKYAHLLPFLYLTYEEMAIRELSGGRPDMALNTFKAYSQIDKNLATQTIASFLTNHLQNRPLTDSIELIELLTIYPNLHESVLRQFQDQSIKYATEKKLDKLVELWPLIRELEDPLQHPVIESISMPFQAALRQMIQDDNADLSQSIPYIQFWHELTKQDKAYDLFPKQLVYLSGTYWITHRHPQKALQLLKIAEELIGPNDSNGFRDAVIHELKVATTYAKHFHLYDILCELHHAYSHFNLGFSEINYPGECANVLADAKFLMKQNRTEKAKQRLKWILCLEPNHENALKMLGFLYFQEQDFKNALHMLSKMKTRDNQAQEVYAHSCLYSGELSEGLLILHDLSERCNLSDSSLYHLGTLEQSPKEAVKWLSQIKNPNPNITMRLFLAYHDLKDWKTALDYFQKLPYTFAMTPSLQQTAVECFTALNQLETARIIFEAMKSNENPLQQIVETISSHSHHS